MSVTVDLAGANTTSVPSQEIWGHFDFVANLQRRDLQVFFDDFNDLPTSGVRWVRDESDATADITLLINDQDGICRIQVDTTDNIEAWMVAGATGGSMVQFDLDNGAIGYEARVRTSSIADNVNGIALGLVEDGLAAGNDVFQTDDDAVFAQLDVVGFQTLQADGDSLDVIHGTNGSAITQLIDGAQTLVADTWYKLGLYFDDSTGICSFYINGTKQSTTVLESATNFPDGGVGLVPFFAAKLGSAATLNFDVDWVLVAQKRVA